MINKPRIEDEIRELKEQSDAAVSACQEAEEKAIMLEEQHEQLLKDIDSLKEEVESTAGNVAVFIENQALIAAQKAELEQQLNVS